MLNAADFWGGDVEEPYLNQFIKKKEDGQNF